MGAIGKLLGVVFGRIIAFFGVYMSGKLLLFTAVVTAFVLLLGGLTLVFNWALASISMLMPAEFQWGMGIIPTNIPTCVAVVLTSRAALWIFQVKWAIVKIKMQG
jgi:hypothetical protein